MKPNQLTCRFGAVGVGINTECILGRHKTGEHNSLLVVLVSQTAARLARRYRRRSGYQ